MGPLQTTPGISTIALSRNRKISLELRKNDVLVFEDIESLIKCLDQCIDQTQRVQVLLNTEMEYMKTLNFDLLFNKTWPTRKNFVVKKSYIQDYFSFDHGSTGLVSIDHTVELLDRCYRQPKFLQRLTEQCKEAITNKFGPDQVTKTMKDIIDSID